MQLKVIYEPYPFNTSLKKSLLSALFFGTFVFLFLLFFQPFGLSNYTSKYKTVQLLGYGLVTFSTLFSTHLLFYFLLPNWYNEKTWTVGKNILFTLLIFILIGTGNLLFTYSQHFISLSLKNFFFYQILTLAVGIFPVVFSTFLVYNRRLNSMVKEATTLNETIKTKKKFSEIIVDIPSQNKSENLSLNIDKILAIKAVENYIEVLILENNQCQKMPSKLPRQLR